MRPANMGRTAPSAIVGGEGGTKAFYGLQGVPDEVIAQYISAPGKLDLPPEILPPALERRRIEHYIPDQAWDIQPAVDVVHVWQIGRPRETASDGGMIVLTEQARDASRYESPRGIIVTAGLLALDHLRSHGMDLGDIAYLLRMSPYRLPMDLIGHRDQGGLLVLHSGDIKGSEDTMQRIRRGELRVKRVKETVLRDGVEVKVERHVYVRSDDTEIVPLIPWQPEET